MRRWSLLLLLALPGCIYQELTATHIEAGGVVTATLNGGGPHTSKGLGDSTKDPFSISGNSPFLVSPLPPPPPTPPPPAWPGRAFLLPLVPGGYVQPAAHADGPGSTADSGTLHLATDASSNL